MAGRRSVWSDPRIVKITEEFIPTTDEVWRLQRVQDSDAIFFQAMANKGHYKGEGQTRQGIYVCSPNGKLLSSINSLKADDVLVSIKNGLEVWNGLSIAERKLPPNQKLKPLHRWEDSYPDQGLVLNSVNADLITDPPLQNNRNSLWNLDHVWFSKSEARQWLEDDPQKGDIYFLPNNLANRLIRFHLVDNVKGQTLPFAPQEIKNSNLKIEVQERQQSLVKIKLRGNANAVAKGKWLLGDKDWTPTYPLNHSMKTEILGKATFNLFLNKFTEFEMVAIGKRYGKTENNSRSSDPDSSYIGFLFTLTEGRASDKIAPGFVDIYNADWITKPF